MRKRGFASTSRGAEAEREAVEGRGLTMSHTPTPWKLVCVEGKFGVDVRGENGRAVASTFGVAHQAKTPEGRAKQMYEDRQNAEIIVTAVNAHERLLASYLELVKALRSAASTAHYRGTLRNGSDFCQGTFDECTNCTSWKTALSKAEQLTKNVKGDSDA